MFGGDGHDGWLRLVAYSLFHIRDREDLRTEARAALPRWEYAQLDPEKRKKIIDALSWARNNPEHDLSELLPQLPFSSAEVHEYLSHSLEFLEARYGGLGTWRYEESGLASWEFQVRGRHDTLRALPSWFASTLCRSLTACERFGEPTQVRITTRTEGRHEKLFELLRASGMIRLSTELVERSDIDMANVDIDLRCLDAASEGFEITRGATLCLAVAPDASDRLSPLRLAFALNADIYAMKTPCVDRDNRVRAQLNGPRLERFLGRLEELTGVELVTIHAPSYDGQVYRYGFKLDDH